MSENGDSECPQRQNGPSDEIPTRSVKDRFFQGADWLSFGITTIFVLCGYLWTLAPSVTLELSGIFCVGAMYGGVPHPPGYPLWTIYAWLFTVLLPVSNIAWRVAVSSAVAGALTCGLIALMTSSGGAVIGRALPRALTPKQFAWLRIISGWLAGMAFGFDSTFWRTAVVANTWPFSLLLFALALALLMRWFCFPERNRWLYWGCFVYGLAVSNSQALITAGAGVQLLIMFARRELARDMFFGNVVLTLAFVLSNGLGGLLPESWANLDLALGLMRLHLGLVTLWIALCIGLIIKTRKFLTEWRGVVASGAMFMAGLAIYLYVPLASMTNPPVNSGYPRTVQGFFHILTRGQYKPIRPIGSVDRFLEACSIYAEVAMRDFGWIYVLMALVPWWFLRRIESRERQWMLGLAVLYLSLSVIMLMAMNPSPDRQSVELYKVLFSASHLILGIFAGYGATLLGWFVAAWRRAE